MKLEGIHHVTAITSDARRNLGFYTGTLGLRLVKKSINQDDATAYHLFYGDEQGSAGADLTFFEYPGLVQGRPGAGMIHRVSFRVSSVDALDFWAKRLQGLELIEERNEERLLFHDPDGLGLEFELDTSVDEPLTAIHPEIPQEFALRGFAGVRAFSADPGSSSPFLVEGLNFQPAGDHGYEVRGALRGSFYQQQRSTLRGLPGSGTVHHVAWAAPLGEHSAWLGRLAEAGTPSTPIIDRYYFRSIYFREPSGVLFEIASIGPGFTVDEPAEHLGEHLSLTPRYEHLRAAAEARLTPLSNPRDSWVAAR